MLYIPEPFVPIFRIKETLPKRLAQCECWDVETERFLIYTLEWDAIASDDPAELARVLLAPTTYSPTTEELKWWIANFNRSIS